MKIGRVVDALPGLGDLEVTNCHCYFCCLVSCDSRESKGEQRQAREYTNIEWEGLREAIPVIDTRDGMNPLSQLQAGLQSRRQCRSSMHNTYKLKHHASLEIDTIHSIEPCDSSRKLLQIYTIKNLLQQAQDTASSYISTYHQHLSLSSFHPLSLSTIPSKHHRLNNTLRLLLLLGTPDPHS